MTTFKAGDKAYHILRGEWVTLKKSGDLIYTLLDETGESFTSDGKMNPNDKYPVLLDHEPESHKWKPKTGDLCWFWDFNGNYTAMVSKFKEMNGNKFTSIGKQDWNFCSPFEGSLPKGVEL